MSDRLKLKMKFLIFPHLREIVRTAKNIVVASCNSICCQETRNLADNNDTIAETTTAIKDVAYDFSVVSRTADFLGQPRRFQALNGLT